MSVPYNTQFTVLMDAVDSIGTLVDARTQMARQCIADGDQKQGDSHIKVAKAHLAGCRYIMEMAKNLRDSYKRGYDTQSHLVTDDGLFDWDRYKATMLVNTLTDALDPNTVVL